MGNRDSDIVDLRGLTLVHKNTGNRTLWSDNHGANDGVIRERLPRGRAAVTAHLGPCTCAIATETPSRRNTCAICGGNSDRRFWTEGDVRRARADGSLAQLPAAVRDKLFAFGLITADEAE